MKLPKELEQSVTELIEQQKAKDEQKTEKINIQEQKERDERVARGNSLINEVKELTGVDCAINYEVIDEVTEIIFDYKEWGLVFKFQQSYSEDSISVKTCWLLSKSIYEGESYWSHIDKNELKNWLANELANAKQKIDKNSKLLAQIEAAKPKFLAKVQEIEDKFWREHLSF